MNDCRLATRTAETGIEDVRLHRRILAQRRVALLSLREMTVTAA